MSRDLQPSISLPSFKTVAQVASSIDWDLRQNTIGDEGATALGEALKNNTVLQTLNLKANTISAEGEKSIESELERRAKIRSQLKAIAEKEKVLNEDIQEASCDALLAEEDSLSNDTSESKGGACLIL